MSLSKSVTFYQQFIWYVADSRPWVPFSACLLSSLCISLFAHLSHAAVLPSALGVGLYISIQGLNYSLHSQSSGPGTSNRISAALLLQSRGKRPIILFWRNKRSWFGKCSEMLDEINSTIYFDLRLYRCLDLADLYASAHILADRCPEICRETDGRYCKNRKICLKRNLSRHLIYPHLKQDGLYLHHFCQATQFLSSTSSGNLCYHFTTQIIRLDIKGTFIALPH